MRKILSLFVVALVFCSTLLQAQAVIESADGVQVSINDATKIITIGGSISETVYALGHGNRVIATDASTTFPPSVFTLPRVPYVRNLTSEGILSLSPTLILSSDDANPASAIQQIRDAQVDILLIEEDESLEGVIKKLEIIGKVLGAEDKALEIIEENQSKYATAENLRSDFSTKPTVMFVLAVRGGSSFMIGGKNTGASKMIELAGGINAFDSFEGYKTATNESILAANPDFILVMQSRYDEISDGISNTPGVNLTVAAQKNQVIGMDGNLLLGFGPRFGSAILDLMKRIHPEKSLDF
ncbi:MAG: ABC transporter substrate-binding protein [Balneolaceae bacterium]